MLRLQQLASALALFVLITACSPATLARDSKQEMYRYVSYSYGPKDRAEIRLDIGKGKIVYPHTFGELTTCGVDGAERCFKSAPLSFCIPKVKEIPSSWQCSGDSYDLIGAMTFQVFGMSIPVAVIRSEDGYFYFNERNGLVAIKFMGDAALSELYISSELNGFGAAERP